MDGCFASLIGGSPETNRKVAIQNALRDVEKKLDAEKQRLQRTRQVRQECQQELTGARLQAAQASAAARRNLRTMSCFPFELCFPKAVLIGAAKEKKMELTLKQMREELAAAKSETQQMQNDMRNFLQDIDVNLGLAKEICGKKATPVEMPFAIMSRSGLRSKTPEEQRAMKTKIQSCLAELSSTSGSVDQERLGVMKAQHETRRQKLNASAANVDGHNYKMQGLLTDASDLCKKSGVDATPARQRELRRQLEDTSEKLKAEVKAATAASQKAQVAREKVYAFPS